MEKLRSEELPAIVDKVNTLIDKVEEIEDSTMHDIRIPIIQYDDDTITTLHNLVESVNHIARRLNKEDY